MELDVDRALEAGEVRFEFDEHARHNQKSHGNRTGGKGGKGKKKKGSGEKIIKSGTYKGLVAVNKKRPNGTVRTTYKHPKGTKMGIQKDGSWKGPSGRSRTAANVKKYGTPTKLGGL